MRPALNYSVDSSVIERQRGHQSSHCIDWVIKTVLSCTLVRICNVCVLSCLCVGSPLKVWIDQNWFRLKPTREQNVYWSWNTEEGNHWLPAVDIVETNLKYLLTIFFFVENVWQTWLYLLKLMSLCLTLSKQQLAKCSECLNKFINILWGL